MNPSDYYRMMHARQGAALDAACTCSSFSVQGEAHALLPELEEWLSVLGSRPEALLLTKASTEYHTGLVLVAGALYRAAFASLRSSLELVLAALEHSAHLLHHQQWLRGGRDINWAALVDNETGVLSKAYCDVFFDDLSAEITHINRLARAAYRACSEYVHGNSSIDPPVPDLLAFSELVFVRWHDVARSVQYVIRFALCARYVRELTQHSLNRLEPFLVDSMSHLRPLQKLLESARK